MLAAVLGEVVEEESELFESLFVSEDPPELSLLGEDGVFEPGPLPLA